MKDKSDYPTLGSVVPETGGAALTLEMFDRAVAFWKSPEYREQQNRAREYAYQQQKAHWERIERHWLKMHNATDMTSELRDQLYDAAWDWMTKNTNILEIL